MLNGCLNGSKQFPDELLSIAVDLLQYLDSTDRFILDRSVGIINIVVHFDDKIGILILIDFVQSLMIEWIVDLLKRRWASGRFVPVDIQIALRMLRDGRSEDESLINFIQKFLSKEHVDHKNRRLNSILQLCRGLIMTQRTPSIDLQKLAENVDFLSRISANNFELLCQIIRDGITRGLVSNVDIVIGNILEASSPDTILKNLSSFICIELLQIFNEKRNEKVCSKIQEILVDHLYHPAGEMRSKTLHILARIAKISTDAKWLNLIECNICRIEKCLNDEEIFVRVSALNFFIINEGSYKIKDFDLSIILDESSYVRKLAFNYLILVLDKEIISLFE